MAGFKFDTKKMHHLNNPERLKDIPPEVIWDKLNLSNAKTLVDLGAGTGFFSKEFSRMPGIEKVYALDIADDMINYMQGHLQDSFPEISPRKMDESQTGLADAIADAVIMINLHHEFHEPVSMLKEIRRILKPEGKVAIIDWAYKEMEHGPPLTKRYKPEQVIKQLRETDYTQITEYHELPKNFLIIAQK